MARLALVVICVAAAFSGARAAAPLNYGMTMADKAFSAVCWYETLKIFPNTKTDEYNHCAGGLKAIQKEIENPSPPTKHYFEVYPDAPATQFGSFFSMVGGLDSLPNADHYKAACNGYIKDFNAAPPSDESDALNDKNKDKYPYKAFAHCLMTALRNKQGEKAITAVKNERTANVKPWRLALLDRDNEFRARHGSEPFTLNTELSNSAQAWAEEISKTCSMQHSPGDKRNWNGEYVGESISGAVEDPNSAAYQASDMWYEEIKNYAFPGMPHQSGAIGHFTQTVWRNSKQAGYGYACNPNCDSCYIVGRYYPGGNVQGVGMYEENVRPPKD